MSQVIDLCQKALIAKFGRSGIWDTEMLAVMAWTVIEALRDNAGELSAVLLDYDEERDGYLTHADAFRMMLMGSLRD